jgi:chemotaxis regulatin CheY-phosphate phosphatase CheZ
MSDIDRTRMIPLHIADQAVAACDAEIAKLREENQRLEAVIESHKDAGLRILAMLDEERRLTKHLKSEVERLEKQTDYERMYRETIELLKKNNL